MDRRLDRGFPLLSDAFVGGNYEGAFPMSPGDSGQQAKGFAEDQPGVWQEGFCYAK